MSTHIEMDSTSKGTNWIKRHKVATIVIFWLFLIVGLRLLGWGMGLACDEALNCLL